MAHLVKSKTALSEKNRLSTTWQAFNDAKKVSGLTFVLDVAAEPETSKCVSFISPEQDALNTCWGIEFSRALKRFSHLEAVGMSHGRPFGIWCNPPFDEKLDFIQKSYDTSRAHGIPVLMMLPYEPNTIWWRVMIDGFARTVYEPRGRYNYYEVDGKTLKRGINFSSCFVLFDVSYINNTQYVKFVPAKLPMKTETMDFKAALKREQAEAQGAQIKRDKRYEQLNRLPSNY